MPTYRPNADKKELFAYHWRILAEGKEPLPEYQFHHTRRWRFDWAWPDERVAVEVEGNAWNVRGGGRHMQDSDMDKYNQAAMLGWRVIRFSPKMLKTDPAGCVELVVNTLSADVERITYEPNA